MAWADHRSLAMLRALPAPHAQALSLFAHIVGAQHVWLHRIEARQPSVAVWPALSLDECERIAAENHAGLVTIAGHDDDALSRVVHYSNSAGATFATPVADILLQVTHHAMYHRGQITMLVKAAGGTPLATDYIAFLRERAQAAPGA